MLRVKGDHGRTKAGLSHHLRFRIVLLHLGVVRVDLGLRFRDRRARLQTRDHVGAASAGMARFRSALFFIRF